MGKEELTGLPPHYLDRLVQVFGAFPRVETVILYGSRAKGEHKPSSDIDLTMTGPALSLQDQFRIEEQLDDLLLPVKIDLSIYEKIDNPELRGHIERVGRVIYKKEQMK